MLHCQRRGRRSRQSVRMTRSCIPPCSPALWLCRQRSGTNRDTAGRRRTSPASHSPLLLCRTDRLCSLNPLPGEEPALWSPIYHPGRPGCDGPQRPPPTQTGSDFTSTVRRLRTSVRVWSGVMRWSSASATSRASRIPVALDLSPQTKRSGPFCPKSGFVLCCSRNVGYQRLAGAQTEACRHLLVRSWDLGLCLQACLYFPF